jgi:hypothetical protein
MMRNSYRHLSPQSRGPLPIPAEGFVVTTFITVRSIARSRDSRRTALSKILPPKMYDVNPVTWLMTVTVDGSRALNPRNLLTLLREARRVAMDKAYRDDVSFKPWFYLISGNALESGRRALAEKRLKDTVYAEFNHVRPYVELLRGSATTFRSSTLADALRLERGSAELDLVAAELLYVGFLRRDGADEYSVPPLYLPSLRKGDSRTERAIVGWKSGAARRIDKPASRGAPPQ